MSQQFNTDFGDDAIYELVRRAHEGKTHFCGWRMQGGTCNAVVQGREISSHLHHHHGVWDSARYRCWWGMCDSGEMTRDSLIRHIQERHLEWKWPCLGCNALFTRSSSLNAHLAKCPRGGRSH